MNTEKAREVRSLLEDITAIDIIITEGKEHDPGKQLAEMVRKLNNFSQGPYYAPYFYKEARELLKKHRDALFDELTVILDRLNEKLLNEY